MRRVVVTGIGMVSPLGSNNNQIFKYLASNSSNDFIINKERINNSFDINKIPLIDKEIIDKTYSDIYYSNSTKYALYSSKLALEDSKLIPNIISLKNNDNIGVSIGTGGITSLNDIIVTHNLINDNKVRKISPYFIPKILTNMASSNVSIKYKLNGPINSPSTACASGLQSIGDAYNNIKYNQADIMVAGGTDSSIDLISIIGFNRLKALSVNNISKPFDKNRDGFILGEGSTVLILEELNNALNRNANIYCEIVGYGIYSDAYHLTSPSPDGNGAINSMKLALRNANINANDVNYINAHATSTIIGDNIEAMAIDTVFNNNNNNNNNLYVSSLKGHIGHLLGAAGAIESAITILSLKNNILIPTFNLNEYDYIPKNFQHIMNKSLEINDLKYCMKNSFGFGGINTSIIFKKYT